MMQLPMLDPSNPDQSFPAIESATKEPDGLLAVGGCLSSQRLISAYKQGIFPWYNPGESILWWSPNPRLVLLPENIIISRSLKKTLRRKTFTVTYDQAFTQVMQYCAESRHNIEGTWISDEMILAYTQLHELGVAHSFEAWDGEQLVGGLYGVAIGHIFFGESMFHKKTDASKVAFCSLVQQLEQWDYQLIDCQVHTAHLSSLGAKEISREEFSGLLAQLCLYKPHDSAWN